MTGRHAGFCGPARAVHAGTGTAQVRSSAGIAVFVGQTADKMHWVDAGRCYERFAPQATALGARNALLNQPVEVGALRPPFATALDLNGRRPDLVVRFGRSPVLPRSLRRPVEAVLVFQPDRRTHHGGRTRFRDP